MPYCSYNPINIGELFRLFRQRESGGMPSRKSCGPMPGSSSKGARPAFGTPQAKNHPASLTCKGRAGSLRGSVIGPCHVTAKASSSSALPLAQMHSSSAPWRPGVLNTAIAAQHPHCSGHFRSCRLRGYSCTIVPCRGRITSCAMCPQRSPPNTPTMMTA